MLWSQRRNSGAHGADNSIQISALAGVEPRTLASIAAADVAIRLPRTPPFSHLLRHAGGNSRTILTPNLLGITPNSLTQNQISCHIGILWFRLQFFQVLFNFYYTPSFKL